MHNVYAHQGKGTRQDLPDITSGISSKHAFWVIDEGSGVIDEGSGGRGDRNLP